MSRILFLGLSVLLALLARPVYANPTGFAYANQLVDAAHKLDLAHQEQWIRLGHWHQQTGPWNHWESQADGDGFFLSPQGREDPVAELDVTLRAFFHPETLYDEKHPHPLCRFPARLRWLVETLSIDVARLPSVRCVRFEEYWNRTQITSATVIFSSYYLNNPASAFGHTFLRLNKGEPGTATLHEDLLDVGVDFAARVDTPNAVIYAFKGLMGLFPGTFNLYPYYYKVREYNDFESRDLWEYDLNLPPKRLAMLVAHLWELGGTHFDYYYLSENCSYHILGALDAADPTLHLTERLRFPVLPVDTIQTLVATPKLLRRVRFRPSQRTQFRARLPTLSSSEQSLVAELVAHPALVLPVTLSVDRQVRVFDAALDLVDMRYASKLLPNNQDSPPHRLRQALLERRAALMFPSEALHVAPNPYEDPRAGHGSRRLGAGVGITDARGPFVHLEGRVALHDFADPRQGYPETSEIEFLPTRLKYWTERQQLWLEDISLIRITSLSPLDRFERQLSWHIQFGGGRRYDDGCNGCFGGLIRGGAGVAASLGSNRLLLFLTADGELFASPDLTNVRNLPARAGLGPAGGLRLRITDGLNVVLKGDGQFLPFQTPAAIWSTEGIVRWAFANQFAFSLEGRARPSATEAVLTSHVYF